jgi:O-antigen/teichoic acid export membrane protein
MAIQLSLFGQGVSMTRELMSNRHVIVSASSVYVTAIAYTLCFLAVRYIVLARLGEAAAGLLQASLSIALTVGSILTPMTNLYLAPILNRTAPAAEKFALAHEFAGRLLPLLFAGALPAVLFPGVVIAVLFTNAFTSAATSLALFVLWQCLYQLIYVYQQLLIGLDQLRFMTMSAIAGFASTAMLAAILVDPLGIAGAPVAMTAGVLLSGALIFFRLASKNGMTIPLRLVARVVYVLTMLALASALFEPDAECVLSGIGQRLGFAAIALGLMWPLLDPAERSLIAHLPKFVLRRLRVAPRNP